MSERNADETGKGSGEQAIETGKGSGEQAVTPPTRMVPEEELRRRNVCECPTCDAWQPRLIKPFCLFCGQSLLLKKCPHCQSLLPHLGSIMDREGKLTHECPFCHEGIEDVYEAMRPKGSESSMKSTLSEEEQVVREIISLGAKDSTFTEAWIKENVEQGPIEIEKVMPSVGGPGPDESFHQCPICSSYISSIARVNDDLSTVMFQDMVSCPQCKWDGEFKSVEWENGAPFFTFDHLLLKGKQIAKMDAALVKCIRAAKAQVSHMSLFGTSEEFDEEPKWPGGLAAALIGTSAFIGQKMDELTRALKAQRQPSRGPKPGGKPSVNRGRGQDHRGQSRGQSRGGRGKDGNRNDRSKGRGPKPNGGGR